MKFTPDLAIKIMNIIMFYIFGMFVLAVGSVVLKSDYFFYFVGFAILGIGAHVILYLKIKHEYEEEEKRKGYI